MTEIYYEANQTADCGTKVWCASDAWNVNENKGICCDLEGKDKSKLGFDGGRYSNDNVDSNMKDCNANHILKPEDSRQCDDCCSRDETEKPNSEPETNNCGEGSFHHKRELGAGAIGVRCNGRIRELCQIFEPKDLQLIHSPGQINDLVHVSRDRGREKIKVLCAIFDNKQNSALVAKKENVVLKKFEKIPKHSEEINTNCGITLELFILCSFILLCVIRSTFNYFF